MGERVRMSENERVFYKELKRGEEECLGMIEFLTKERDIDRLRERLLSLSEKFIERRRERERERM